jgi:hypothetical protein
VATNDETDQVERDDAEQYDEQDEENKNRADADQILEGQPLVTPDQSFKWASRIIHQFGDKPSAPHELLGTAHMVVQLYFISTQINILNNIIYDAVSPSATPRTDNQG